MSQPEKVRAWCFTINNYTVNDWMQVKALTRIAAYVVCGEELAPTTGTPHLQGYVRLRNAKSRLQMSKVLNRASLLQANGPDLANQTYCSKGENIFEFGTPGEQGKRTDLAEIALLIRNKEVSLEDVMFTYPVQYAQAHRAFKDMFTAVMLPRTEAPMVTWLWGLAGVGKTRWAHDKFTAAQIYMKDNTPWWDGYRQQECIVIDDFEEDIPYRTFLKMLDRYAYQGQVKGGYVQVNSPHIIITCEYPPSHFWEGNKLAQVARRLTHIENLC